MKMPSMLQYRLLGYTGTLAVHLLTFADVISRLAVTTKDPVVAEFATLQTRFLTIWTFIFQIMYVTFGMTCDLLSLVLNKRNFILSMMNGIREELFHSILWPTSLLVPVMFWPMYLYDPGLVFPPFVDKILSSGNNQVMHTFVAIFAVWELNFFQKKERKHARNLTLLFAYIIAYVLIMVDSYVQRGKWVYPILGKIYGTVYFWLFFVLVAVLLVACYSLQWLLMRFFAPIKKKSGKKSR